MSGERKVDEAPRVLVIGSGAREHALAVALARSPSHPAVHVIGTSTNPAISSLCEATGGTFIVGDILDAVRCSSHAESLRADLVVIGPEAPLDAGVADATRLLGIPVMGPDRSLARIETSKAFARALLDQAVPGASPRFRTVTSMEQAREFLDELGDDYVIKADGLTGGKGVKVAGDHLFSRDEALAYCAELLTPPATDTPHASVESLSEDLRCVIEEKMVGEEFSLMTLTDGITCVHMPAIQDHKRAYVDDKGPNTGGMGCYSDADHALPFLDPEDYRAACLLNEQVAAALSTACGAPYRGILYGGFMAVRDGVRIVEYNARFGDPESLNLLTLLTSDAYALFLAAAEGRLAEAAQHVTFADKASVCKYVVPEGYPGRAVRHAPLDLGGLTPGSDGDLALYLGSVDIIDGLLVTGGSRTAAVVALADTLAEAERKAERAISQITGRIFHRPDIGTGALLERRVTHMQEIRG